MTKFDEIGRPRESPIYTILKIGVKNQKPQSTALFISNTVRSLAEDGYSSEPKSWGAALYFQVLGRVRHDSEVTRWQPTHSSLFSPVA
jgi:hypothetical protein